MPQKKINTFFRSEKGSSNTSGISTFNKRCWTTSSSQFSALQKYHESRKQAKLKQTKEASDMACESSKPSSQNSQFTHSLDILDDSQSFSNAFQGTDSNCWMQNNGNSNFPYTQPRNSMASYPLENSQLSLLGSSQKRREFEQYMGDVKQEQKERQELEMLKNFLLTAKKCCEDTNDVAKNIYKKFDESTSSIVWAMKDCLEKNISDLLKTLKENEDGNDTTLQKKLNEMQDKFSLGLESTHKSIEVVLKEASRSVRKATPTLCSIACQYSPPSFCKPMLRDTACQSSPYCRKKVTRSFEKACQCSLLPDSASSDQIESAGRHQVEKNERDSFWQWDLCSETDSSLTSIIATERTRYQKSNQRSPLSTVTNRSRIATRNSATRKSTRSRSKVTSKKTPTKKSIAHTSVSKLKSNARFAGEREATWPPSKKPAERTTKRNNCSANSSQNFIQSGVSGASVTKSRGIENVIWNFGSFDGPPKPNRTTAQRRPLPTKNKITWLSSGSDDSDSTFTFHE